MLKDREYDKAGNIINKEREQLIRLCHKILKGQIGSRLGVHRSFIERVLAELQKGAGE